MKWVFRVGVGVVVLAVCGLVLFFSLPLFNEYQTQGRLSLPGLGGEVRVTRDDTGMAYIHANNKEDLFFAQGFVTAQDRLFQMQLTRLYFQGRLCELAGEKARDVDLRMRTIGLHRMAKKHAKILSPDIRRLFQRYVDGVNAFIQNCPEDIHLEFKLAGLTPDLWSVEDSLGFIYYMGYSTAANLTTEVIAQMLLDTLGVEKTALMLPRNINVDDPADTGETAMPPKEDLDLAFSGAPELMAFARDRKLRVGSNNWAMAPAKSRTGAAVLSGDPHLDPRMLPGVWYPLGMICPGIRAVGTQIPGIPGMSVGRTDHVALSATNNYGDMVDLYIETIDPDNPDHYMEGKTSVPFVHIKETLKIKDKEATGGFREENLDIRATRRGPVVSRVLKGLDAKKTMTLRFAPAEFMPADLTILDVLTAKDAGELARIMRQFPTACFNWVFADSQGNIGHQASGVVPLRTGNDGTFPHVVKDGQDNWQGRIPPEQMPGTLNPEKNWIGTCNHKTVTSDFPFYYSSYFAPSYRYERLKQLMGGKEKLGIDDMWRFQRDTENLMARRIAPVMAKVLSGNEATQDLGNILAQWDFKDDPETAGPTIFQTVYQHFAFDVFEDELGAKKAMTLLNSWYFWEERLQQFVLRGRSPFFDDTRTAGKTETMADLFIRAALQTRQELAPVLGKDPGQWMWGKVHTLELVNPLVRSGKAKPLLGTGPMPMGGSGETLYRGWYDYDTPYEVTHCASLRLVADLGDSEKLMAVLPGGVAGRTFHRHQKDQVKKFMEGTIQYWWFSDAAIEKNAKDLLVLTP